ncbi:MAG TPA: hypothetical protein ENK44_09525 [Caldithrix abyssi]|uniref:Uncharacterized protein n=1 Tax=Caldithrix abyssi TaxID=187145 RepID=A0A7V4U0U5_CALAY|nr:hypothetical protein [Caldithrix abyssi]
MRTLFISLIIISFVFIKCSKNSIEADNSNNISKNEVLEAEKNVNQEKKNNANLFLNKLAIQIANRMAVLDNSEYLFSLLDKQNIQHPFLSLSDVLESPIFKERFITTNFMNKIGYTDIEEIKQFIKTTFPFGVIIHFPIKKHLYKYKPGQSLLIAVAPFGIDENNINNVLAFDLEGHKYSLDAKTPPEEPTLVIAPGEPFNIINEQLPCEDPEDPDCQGGPPGGQTKYYRLQLEDINLVDPHEDWPFMPAEIYFKVTYSFGNEPWQTTFTPWDDYEGWVTDQFLNIYRNTNYGEEWYVEVWEDDTGLTGSDDFIDSWYTLGNGVLHGSDDNIQCRFVRDYY